jgi:subtilisin family serine protease
LRPNQARPKKYCWLDKFLAQNKGGYMGLLLFVPFVVCLGTADIHQHGFARPYTVFPDENPTVIAFSNGIVFDTRDGEPVLPRGLRIEYQDSGYYLVQLNGPIYQHWVEELKQIGAVVVGYAPKYAFIVYANQEQLAYARAKPFVRWTGIFQPAYKIEKDLIDAAGQGRITIQLFPDEDIQQIADQIRTIGGEVTGLVDHPLCKTIDVVTDLERAADIAAIPGVMWIQRWSQAVFCNNNIQWVLQTGHQPSVPPDSIGRRVWREGLTGGGLVLSTSDSGIRTDHVMFYDPSCPINSPGVYHNHRKIVAYKLFEGGAFSGGGGWFHGTFVNCTLAGNDTLLGTSSYDGMAKDARIYFVDFVDDTSNLQLPSNLTVLYDTIYSGQGLGYNILQHSGSWGFSNYSGAYLIQDAANDAYVWAHRDFLNLYAAGNYSLPYRIISPAIAKNTIAVGGTGNGILSNTIWYSSSRGPTQDHRIKPTLMAPGTGIISADGETTNGYTASSGTSFATPAISGSVGLIRQYLLAGFYPSGTENPADSIKYQSAALLRAMAIASCDPNIGSYVVPDSNIGWGRIDLDSVLYFDGDARKLIILDDTIGINTGQSVIDSFIVNSNIPLRICLAWSDTAAAPTANPTLVNDINLELTAPSGPYYRGNQYSGGQSIENPVDWDDRNVEECIRVNDPEVGTWYVSVNGQNVPFGPQPFAYAVTGDIEAAVRVEEGNNPAVQGTAVNFFSSIVKERIHFEITLCSSTEILVEIIDVSGRMVNVILSTRLTAGRHDIERSIELSSGVYFLKIQAGDYSVTEKVLLIR